jgi:hypothetical protein
MTLLHASVLLNVKILCCSPSPVGQPRATVPLKARNANFFLIKMGQNVKAMGWPKLQWFKVSHYDKPFTFLWDMG